MKKSTVLFVSLSIISACVLAFLFVVIRSSIYISPREKMQEDLAKKLGIRIDDYPNKPAFPVGYFRTVLQPGMTMSDVHKIVQGYEKVLHCGSKSEIYYYFSSEVEDAKRFELRYDDQGLFSNLEGEEDNSRTLQTFDCEPGRIIR